MNPEFSIIVPLYNEKEVFNLLVSRLQDVMSSCKHSVETVFIDDGSSDGTDSLIEEICNTDPRFRGIILSRNFGHQIALTAGLKESRCTEGAMVIDGDLQDPPEMLHEFIKHYHDGYDVLFAVRKKRKEGFLKRIMYFFYYRILSSISYIKIPLDSGDFSLISRKVIDVLNDMPEQSRFIRGMRTWSGFKQKGIEYERQTRAAGKPKYSIKKLFELAYSGIFNFSEIPIKLLSRMGFLIILISVVYFIFILYKKIFYGDVPEGFTTLMFTIILFSGVQLISIGIIGEYIIKIFFEVKKRPLYIIKQIIENG